MIQRQLLRLSKRVDDGKVIKLFDSSLLPVLFCHEIGVIGYMLPKPINYSVLLLLQTMIPVFSPRHTVTTSLETFHALVTILIKALVAGGISLSVVLFSFSIKTAR